ncbi:putative pentatricopeptide repeat-containing protein At5g08490 [Malania oleifera]|uniref:putative pentatricopeptide repeat-containing protein At5g08490 n=1 Tax=Malania oleifera TaxID=397392 RepID=UPI0025AE57DA|nr:putative pentatricopeptide repeat-containing protein At5g08490 [Malania oleifera]XP_057950218.1 putative pentatricopeptide repeat-containing protein At5g08490 [Malania oleifera]XP_057950219.1 putative pentatricopeptide repeat-containing protein At5g08490 [Malania oleifera]XP_057950220.1 putative pentatricopeptide repeat-containing protein At5g08490 [Malania oleifera]XP_057950221.1 putative pentatricopeptide repeat-containing protein At5g08490 [Malania oleifera]XP_057950222.1 putative pentat
MIRRGCSINATHDESLPLFLQKIRCAGCKPDHQVFASLLKACAAISAIKLGEAVHSYVAKLGHLSCYAVSKAVLNMYAKCGALDDCKKLFNEMGHCDPVTWNIVLSGFSGSRVYDAEVIRLFYAMHLAHEPKPNSVSIAVILPVCARLGELDAGKSVHSYAIKSGLESQTLVGNALVSLYAKCGLVRTDACAAFQTIDSKDIVSWNAMIAGFSENNYMTNALELFHLMLEEPIEPNYATVANILPVCASLEKNNAFCIGKRIHCYVLRRTELATNVSVSNALMSFYQRIGFVEEAELIFQRMQSKDIISWNAIIAGYISNGEWSKSLVLFREFLSSGLVGPDSITLISILPACARLYDLHMGKKIHGYTLRHPNLRENTAVGNALISFYAKCNDINAAFRIFLMISKRDLISWNAMLDALAESESENQFNDVLHWMLREGVRPDPITILSMIYIFASFCRMDKVKEVHGYSFKAGFLQDLVEPTIWNALLDAYAKCSNMEYATKIFESLLGKRNVVTCNSMISGYLYCGLYNETYKIFNDMSEADLTTWNLMIRVYAENGCVDQALSLFHELQAQGMKPDTLSIMSILPVSAQMASVQLLRQLHGYIVRACFEDHCLKGALLDGYSKCGTIRCASTLFQSTLHKDLVMFTAMIGGYAMHGMGEEAVRTYHHMLQLGLKPDHVIITAVLSACSHAGLVDEGWKIFDSIEKVHGVKPTMEQYACAVDLLARRGRVKDAYSFVTRMPINANANVWGTLLGACRTHHEVELGRIVANHLFEIEANNIGNYVVMSNLYAADARWDGVMDMRRLMRTRDLRKPAGCSWVEMRQRKSIFIAGDSSHPQRSVIYSVLGSLDQQMKDPFQF